MLLLIGSCNILHDPCSSLSLLFTNLVISLNEKLDTSIRVLYSMAGGWEGEGGGLLTNYCNWPAGYQLVREWNASVLPYRELYPAKLSDTLSQKDDKASWVVSNSLTVRQNLLPVLRNHPFPWIFVLWTYFEFNLIQVKH